MCSMPYAGLLNKCNETGTTRTDEVSPLLPHVRDSAGLSRWHDHLRCGCRVGVSLVQVPFAMDAVVIAHSLPGALAQGIFPQLQLCCRCGTLNLLMYLTNSLPNIPWNKNIG